MNKTKLTIFGVLALLLLGGIRHAYFVYLSTSAIEDDETPTIRKDDRELGGKVIKMDTSFSPTSAKRSRRYPDAMIIGVEKAGTKALLSMLELHPQTATASGEINFFDKDHNFEKGLQWYLEQMPLSESDQITIEKSPQFGSICAPERIRHLFPHVKLIVIVKNPISRTISQYLERQKRAVEFTFEEEVLKPNGGLDTIYHPINYSLYDYHFRRWLQSFPLEQFHIVDGDKLAKVNPVPQLVKVAKFLNLPPYYNNEMFFFNETKGFYCWKKPIRRKPSETEVPFCLGKSKGREHPTVSEEVLEKMRELYKPHMQEFYRLAGQNFGWTL